VQQHAHRPSLQTFLHLPVATTSREAGLGAALAAVVLACLWLVLPVASAGAATTSCAGANLAPTATDVAAVDAATLCLVDQIRAAHHLRPLRANRELGHVAASQVVHMVSADYFADNRPSGQTPLSLVRVTRYPSHAANYEVGQNIAWGTGAFSTPAHIVAEWMASPPHREVMLSPQFRDAGVAVTTSLPAVLDRGRHGATYAIEFGVRRF
jgi:uncharacterized protein YkwD